MNLNLIMNGIEFDLITGDIDININKIEYDSRKIEKGDIFFCIEGFNTDGHSYVEKAIEKGAAAIVCEKAINQIHSVPVLKVKDSRKALALASANYYEHPEKKLKIVGITGTNGKTTSTFMLKAILEKSGFKVGIIGTIANYIDEEKIETHRTTPESLELFSLFKNMVDKGIDYCIMEVSSHSLYLNRVYGINFEEGIFTNLTQDHLDFHKTFENYYKAKLILFKNSKISIINMDDEYGKRVFLDSDNEKLTFGIESDADLVAKNVILHSRGIEFDVYFKGNTEHINLNQPGKYNLSNALGCIGVALKENISLTKIKEGLESLYAVPGRSEIVTQNLNLGFDVIVDYAHTPDGLIKILNTAREFTKGRLICVFGCGGDRDKTKRPIMGNIGTELSDIAIITSDNPRTEEPITIIQDVLAGVKKDNYIVEENRKLAIKKALETAKKDDVIVIAGKGHEDYQILKDKTIHFDEREIINELIKEIF